MIELFLEILNRSISASWLILAVVAIRLLLKKAPKWMICMLWCMVAVRLIMPISIESAFSMIPSAEVVTREILYETSPTIHSGMSSVDRVVNPMLQENFSPTPGASVNPLQVVTFVAANLWVLGIVMMTLYMLFSYYRLHKRVGEAVLLKCNIFCSERISAPFVLGIVKPRIYVPFTLEGEDLDCVIAHERAHITRFDYLLKPVAFLILTVYWFHPLVWLAYILLCRDIEYACDQKVLGKLDVQQKKVYSRALLRCSTGEKSMRRLITACPVAFGEVGVKSRVKSVLYYRKPGFWVLLVAVLACVICCVCFMTEPKQEEEKGAAANVLVQPIAVENEITKPVIGGEENKDVIKDVIIEAMGTDMAENSVYIQPGEGAVMSAPPAMMLQDVYGIVEDSFAVLSETYALHCKGASDTAAEGLIPVAAGVDNDRKYATAAVKGAEWLQLYTYSDLEYAPYKLSFSKVPDMFTVREYDLLHLGDIHATPDEENTYTEMTAMDLKPRRIYEIEAEWSEERLGENGFYGTATYIFATDNYLKKTELAWHDVAYTYDMSEVWISEEHIASIRVTQGWTGQEKTFGVTDSSHGYKDILNSYYQLNVMPKEALEQRIGYQYCMRLYDSQGELLQTITPYKDCVCIDGAMYDGSLNGTSTQLLLLLDALDWGENG